MSRGARRSVSVLVIAVVRNNIVPFVGRRARYKRYDGFGITDIEDFVRHAGPYVNKIACFVLQHLLKPGSEFVAHFSFEDVKNHFEIDMNMGISDAARRNSGDVG